jgi:hypothetical protein
LKPTSARPIKILKIAESEYPLENAAPVAIAPQMNMRTGITLPGWNRLANKAMGIAASA